MRTHDLTTVEGVLSALDINPEWPIGRREQAIKLECANYNALVEIASALNCEPPSSLDRVSGIVSAVWALKHKSSEVAAVARHDGGLVEELRADLADAQAKIASNVADLAARDMRIAELERDLTTKADTLKTAHAALKRICEIVGAPVPCVAEDAVDGARMLRSTAQHANVRATQAEATLAEIGLALEDVGAPQTYHLEDDTERGIPDPERIRLLGERIRTLRAQVREAADATNYLDALIEAHNALDVLKAPRLADGCVLSLAARIRAIPR